MHRSGKTADQKEDQMLKTLWRRTAGVAALVTLATLTLGACASPSNAAAPAKPEKTTTAAAEPEAATLRPAGAPCTADNAGSDDVIGLEQITDDRGTYCHVTWDPDSPDLVWDPATLDSSVAENKFTAEEAKTARDTALTFLIEDVLDSPLYDNPAADRSAWLTERKPLMTKFVSDYYEKATPDHFAIPCPAA